MRGTRPSPYWSVREPSWRRPGSLSSRAGRHSSRQPLHDPHGRGRRFRSLRSCPHRTVPRGICGEEAWHHAPGFAWRWAGRIRTIRRSPSTWLIWQSAGSGSVNGVSRLHGKVSRHLFEPLFPRWPEDEVPVGYVTNGVHMPTWDSAAADDLWTKACGKGRWLGTTENLEQNIRRSPTSSFGNFVTPPENRLLNTPASDCRCN